MLKTIPFGVMRLGFFFLIFKGTSISSEILPPAPTFCSRIVWPNHQFWIVNFYIVQKLLDFLPVNLPSVQPEKTNEHLFYLLERQERKANKHTATKTFFAQVGNLTLMGSGKGMSTVQCHPGEEHDN